MDRLDRIEKILEKVAKSQADADRQRAKDKAESDRQRAKDRAEFDRQRAEDKAEFDRQCAKDKAKFDRQCAKDKAEFDRQCAKDKAESDRQRAKDKAEADKRAAEADKRAAEADERSAKADKERAELRVQMEKTAIQHKNTEILVGHMNNRFGDLAESMLVGDVIETLKKIDNLHLKHTYFNAKHLNGNRVECEIDALLVGQDSVVVMEAKATLTTDKINHFITDKLKSFTKHFPEFADKKIYGAVGYLKTVGDAVELAINEGLLVVRSTLQAKEIVNPTKFQPKDYNPKHLTRN